MVSTAHKPTPFLLIVIVCLLAVPPVASAAPPGSVYGACFQLDAAHPHSAACSAEIAAHPLPAFYSSVCRRRCHICSFVNAEFRCNN